MFRKGYKQARLGGPSRRPQVGVLVRTAYAVDLVKFNIDAANTRKTVGLNEIDQTDRAINATNDAMKGILAAGSGEAGEDNVKTALARKAIGKHLLEGSKTAESLKSVRRI